MKKLFVTFIFTLGLAAFSALTTAPTALAAGEACSTDPDCRSRSQYCNKNNICEYKKGVGQACERGKDSCDQSVCMTNGLGGICCLGGQIVKDGACVGTAESDGLDQFNPLLIAKSEDIAVQDDLSTPGGIITRVLRYAFPIAGMILFVMIVIGGFQMVASATSSKSIETGKQRISNAVVGFLLLFVSYWIVQVLQVVFGFKLL